MYATLSKFEQEIQQSDVQKVLVFKPLKTQHCKMSLTTIIQQSAMMPTGYLIAKSNICSFWVETEKLWGELLFPEEKMVVFSTENNDLKNKAT